MLNLKRFLIFSILLILALLFAGCGGNDDEGDLTGDGNGASWLATIKAGSWAEYVSPDGTKTRMEYLGEDTWQGTQCMVLEYETTPPGESPTISQMWFDKAAMKSVVVFFKMDNVVYRMDVTQYSGETPGQETWEQPNTQNLGTDEYTTPTGKTVNVTKYLTTGSYGTSESWVSSEVPFQQVKEISNGELESSLYDFGTSGAARSISKQEAENAQPFGIPGIGNGGDGNGNGGDVGGIKITVGAGNRPTITVSKPINSLIMVGGQVLWGFNVQDPPGSLAGPFKYGETPAGAEDAGLGVAPPDLMPGVTYQINVFGPDFGNGDAMDMGFVSFTR